MNSKNKRQLAGGGWAQARGRAWGAPLPVALGTQCLGSWRSSHSGWMGSGALRRVQLTVASVRCGGSQRMEGLVRCWAQPGLVPGLGVSEQPSVLAQRA